MPQLTLNKATLGKGGGFEVKYKTEELGFPYPSSPR